MTVSVMMEDNVSLVQARHTFQEGNFLESSALYDKLLASDSQKLEFLLGKANCLVSLCQWTECFKYITKAVQHKNWKSSLLDHLISNLLKTLMTKKEIPKRPHVAQEIQQNILLCAICLQLIYDPTTLLCGHSFCRRCALKQGKGKCFHCIDVETDGSDEFSSNFILASIIQKCFKHKTKAVELRYKGNDHCSKHDYGEALKEYREALTLDANNHLILSNLSHVTSVLGDYENALDYAEKACTLMPNCKKAFYRKACALTGLKNYSQAVIAYLQLLLIDSKNEVGRKSLTKVLIEILTSEKQSEKDEILGAVLNDLATSLDVLLKEEGSGVKDIYVRENESALSENLSINDLECSLCCRMFYHPVTCPCGHTFCQWCLNRCLDHNPSCPICRYPVEKYIGDTNQNVTQMIEKLCEKYFPKEFQERKTRHEEEINRLASVALDTAENIPVFVCTLALPTIPCSLHIFEPRYRLMVRECMESGSRQFGMCIPSQDHNSFSDYGVMLEIQDFRLLSDGRSLIQSVGGRRFKVLSRGMKDGYHTAQVEWLKDRPISEDELVDITDRQLRIYENVKNWLSALPSFVKLG